jgi:hypothetical protein
MDADRAQALAETLHHGQRDAGGAPLIDHIRRIAAAVPGEARAVAWLHEALEHAPISEEALLNPVATHAPHPAPAARAAGRADTVGRSQGPAARRGHP